MAKYLHKGSTWRVSADADADMRDVLPVATYIVKLDSFGVYYLEEVRSFHVGKVYGNAGKLAARILNTYSDRSENTGVLAVGAKGTGKTMLARLVSIRAAELGIPTVLVNDAFHGDVFNAFVASINCRCVFLFDEYEKVYEGVQEALLTLFDGVYQMNKLFILTANSEQEVDRCMISRPGRIYYNLEYGALDAAFIDEYCRENLNDHTMIPHVMAVAELYGNFSFDVVRALVEEMNRYDEAPHEVLRYLNIRQERWRREEDYIFTVMKDGVPLADSALDERYWSLDPSRSSCTVRVNIGGTEDGEENTLFLRLHPSNMVDYRDRGRRVVYRDKGYDVVAVREDGTIFDPVAILAAGYDSAVSRR